MASVAFRRRILTLFAIDCVCLLLAFSLSAVLVSHWHSTTQLLDAYADAALAAQSSAARGPYGTYTVPAVYTSNSVTGSVTYTFTGARTLSSLDGTRAVPYTTVVSSSTAVYNVYSRSIVLDGTTTITGYRNVASLLSSYTSESSRVQASIDAARGASSAVDGISSRRAASASATSASATSASAPQRRLAAPIATAALARRQPAPAPTAAPQPVARRDVVRRRAASTGTHVSAAMSSIARTR